MDAEEQRRRAYLAAMGVQVWEPRRGSPVPAATGAHAVESMPPVQVPLDAGRNDEGIVGWDDEGIPAKEAIPASEPDLHTCGWDELATRVAACTACPLHLTRTQTVFGVGDRAARWMIIGEAPGEQEDLQGEPFVGRAGLLLNEMLRAVGLQREQVYIANVLKCRPPKNRDPQPDEAAACEGYLKRQLELAQPDIILAVGRIAAQNLLKTTTPIGKLRGRVHEYQGVPLVVTYHPAYLLRSPLEKRRAWDDLRLAWTTYRQLQPH
jgi:DNA polymerase